LLDDPFEFDDLVKDLQQGFKENYVDFETAF